MARKIGIEITWNLFQYPDAEEKARKIYKDLENKRITTVPFDALYHIEKRYGQLGYKNPEACKWGTPVQTYSSLGAAKKALYRYTVNLIYDSK